jgi:hypothetical protein
MTSLRSGIRTALVGVRHEKDRPSRRYLQACRPGWKQSLGAFTAELSESGQDVPRSPIAGGESRKGCLRNPFMGKSLD